MFVELCYESIREKKMRVMLEKYIKYFKMFKIIVKIGRRVDVLEVFWRYVLRMFFWRLTRIF